MRQVQMLPKFVDFIPEVLDDGVLYIALRFSTASHKCCCGCGSEVVTPLTPTDWSLKKDGSLVTLHPSIGNWSYQCQSHYFIRRNRVVWAGPMTGQRIAQGREAERLAKASYFKVNNSAPSVAQPRHARAPVTTLGTVWATVKRWFSA